MLGSQVKCPVSGDYGSISGGESNHAQGEQSHIGGGLGNSAEGTRSAIPGGDHNIARGFTSFAAGRRAQALHDGAFVWADNPGFIAFASTAPNQFLIRASGGVGIGTNSPSTALEVDGTVTATAFVGDGSGLTNLPTSGDGHSLDAADGDPGDALFVDNEGNVGIGTTNPTATLHVNGTALATAHTTPSSRRWKQNIAPIDRALEKVLSMRGVSYDWMSDGRHDIGLIAEEVGEVIPEIVVFEENGRDAKSVDYARLVAVLIEAVKAQQEEIDELKAAVYSFTASR